MESIAAFPKWKYSVLDSQSSGFHFKKAKKKLCPQSEKNPKNLSVVSETKPGGMKEKNHGGKTLVYASILALFSLISLCRVESQKFQLLDKKWCSPH